MSSGYHRLGANANIRPEQVFGLSRTDVRPIANLMQKLHDLFGDKLAAEIACRSGTSVRAAEHVIYGRNGFSFSAGVNLIRSDIGDMVVDALMCDPVPSWYAQQKLVLDIAEAERRAIESKNQLASLRRDLTRR